MEILRKWKRERKFDLTKELNKVNGPIIEIGGPTETSFPLVNWSKVKKRVFTSNIEPGAPTFDSRGRFSHYYGKVDFQADARELPFANQSIGAIRADSLPPDVLDDAIDEMRRVLVRNGLLIIQGLDSDDVLFIANNGFTLIQYQLKDEEPYYTVFRKND